MTDNNAAPIIETRDLTIRFGGHVAVDHVNFSMQPFTLKSIIGPNGAGKTTFFNMLTGQYKPTRGKRFSERTRHHPFEPGPDGPDWAWGAPFS